MKHPSELLLGTTATEAALQSQETSPSIGQHASHMPGGLQSTIVNNGIPCPGPFIISTNLPVPRTVLRASHLQPPTRTSIQDLQASIGFGTSHTLTKHPKTITTIANMETL